ncbi:hypothetical protein B2J93_7574 [Marssonina coronariae]|uniref:Uncharacterized protein n=1 Tax=Diplocarpon coronariae TaxID=2795749 RepID=A0A218Z8P1_9HELO|nr:hypothetical protein B2J93_7574 [Marssonina coronariae]
MPLPAPGVWHLASGIWRLASAICHLPSGVWQLPDAPPSSSATGGSKLPAHGHPHPPTDLLRELGSVPAQAWLREIVEACSRSRGASTRARAEVLLISARLRASTE